MAAVALLSVIIAIVRRQDTPSWSILGLVVPRFLRYGLLALGQLACSVAGARPSTARHCARRGLFRSDAGEYCEPKAATVFVYFTADWCVTCKVNEAAAINREETERAFAKAGIVNVLKGDFTRRDPAIARFLAKHGRSGVPLYLYYPKGGEPEVLPQILTVDTLTALAK